jgi:CheY-like chemotaxis protein
LRHQPAPTGGTNLENPVLERVHVLIADGNVGSARILSDHFQTWKMRSEVAANSALAMVALNDAIAAGDPFEIAVIDLQVPDSGGLALARAIQQSPQLAGIRVVGIHELGDRSAAGRVKAAGIRALIARPLRQSRLYNILVTLMASPQDGLVSIPSRRRLARPLQSVVPAEIRERTRILLVEDNLVNQQVEIRMIERIGYRADFVENGASALERLNHTDYDLILMDCQMPGMDGYRATYEIRRREGATRHTPIIGLTARALAGDRDDCIRAGMDDYLSKPVMPEDLGAIIDKWAMVDAQRTLVSEPPTAPIDAVMIAPPTAVITAPIEAVTVPAPRAAGGCGGRSGPGRTARIPKAGRTRFCHRTDRHFQQRCELPAEPDEGGPAGRRCPSGQSSCARAQGRERGTRRGRFARNLRATRIEHRARFHGVNSANAAGTRSRSRSRARCTRYLLYRGARSRS